MDFLKKTVDTSALADMLETLAADIRSGTIEVTKAKGDEIPEASLGYGESESEFIHTGRYLGDLKLSWTRRKA